MKALALSQTQERPGRQSAAASTLKVVVLGSGAGHSFVNGIHTLPEQAADIFNRVKPRLAVYAHAPVSDDLIARTRKTYAGRVEGADDMMTIEIGQSIEIRRFGR